MAEEFFQVAVSWIVVAGCEKSEQRPQFGERILKRCSCQ